MPILFFFALLLSTPISWAEIKIESLQGPSLREYNQIENGFDHYFESFKTREELDEDANLQRGQTTYIDHAEHLNLLSYRVGGHLVVPLPLPLLLKTRPEKKSPQTPHEVFFTETELKSYRLVNRDGFLRMADGTLFDTSDCGVTRDDGTQVYQGATQFIMTWNGVFYVNCHAKTSTRSFASLARGRPVAAAGFLKVDMGRVKSLITRNSHYPQTRWMGQQAVQELVNQGAHLALSEVQFWLVGPEQATGPLASLYEQVALGKGPTVPPAPPSMSQLEKHIRSAKKGDIPALFAEVLHLPLPRENDGWRALSRILSSYWSWNIPSPLAAPTETLAQALRKKAETTDWQDPLAPTQQELGVTLISQAGYLTNQIDISDLHKIASTSVLTHIRLAALRSLWSSFILLMNHPHREPQSTLSQANQIVVALLDLRDSYRPLPSFLPLLRQTQEYLNSLGMVLQRNLSRRTSDGLIKQRAAHFVAQSPTYQALRQATLNPLRPLAVEFRLSEKDWIAIEKAAALVKPLERDQRTPLCPRDLFQDN